MRINTVAVSFESQLVKSVAASGDTTMLPASMSGQAGHTGHTGHKEVTRETQRYRN